MPPVVEIDIARHRSDYLHECPTCRSSHCFKPCANKQYQCRKCHTRIKLISSTPMLQKVVTVCCGQMKNPVCNNVLFGNTVCGASNYIVVNGAYWCQNCNDTFAACLDGSGHPLIRGYSF